MEQQNDRTDERNSRIQYVWLSKKKGDGRRWFENVEVNEKGWSFLYIASEKKWRKYRGRKRKDQRKNKEKEEKGERDN